MMAWILWQSITTGMAWQGSVTFLNIKFHEDPLKNQAICGHRDRMTLIRQLHQFYIIATIQDRWGLNLMYP
jgi:hypothetical protein